MDKKMYQRSGSVLIGLAALAIVIWLLVDSIVVFPGEIKLQIEEAYNQRASDWDNHAWATALSATEFPFNTELDVGPIVARLRYSKIPETQVFGRPEGGLGRFLGVWNASKSQANRFFPKLPEYDEKTDCILWGCGFEPLDVLSPRLDVAVRDEDGTIWYCKLPRWVCADARQLTLVEF